MHVVAETEWVSALAQAGVAQAHEHHRIGKELQFGDNAKRTVVAHLGMHDAPYVEKLLRLILSVANSWILAPRYGEVSSLGFGTFPDDIVAMSLAVSEFDDIVESICAPLVKEPQIKNDIYLLSGTGRILITWDHHTLQEGLKIELTSIDDANQLLRMLNELGTEMEVFYNDC